MVQNAETKLQCVCEGLATGSRHMRWLGDCFAMIFVAVREACEDDAIPCKGLVTV